MSSEHHKRQQAKELKDARAKMKKENERLAKEQKEQEKARRKAAEKKAAEKRKQEEAQKLAAEKRERKRKEEEDARRQALERKREKERQREASRVAKLQKDASNIKKKYGAVNRQVTKTQNQLNKLKNEVGNIDLEKMSHQIKELHENQSKIRTDLTKVKDGYKGLNISTTHLQSSLRKDQEKIKILQASWTEVLKSAEENKGVSVQAFQKMQQIDRDVNDVFTEIEISFEKVNEVYSDIENYNKEIQALDSIQLIKDKIHLFDSSPAVSLSTFLEIEALQENGYELKGIITNEDIDLWFEEKNGERKVALKIKQMVEGNGIEWLREFDITGFNKEEEKDFVEDYIETMGMLGVDYILENKRKPRNPPPDSQEVWERIVALEQKGRAVQRKPTTKKKDDISKNQHRNKLKN